MPEFLRLLSPQEARDLLLSNLPSREPLHEVVRTVAALDRVAALDVRAPHPLPEFARSTVDGYALLAADTFGASDSLPAYLNLIGEVQMGGVPPQGPRKGECLTIHTGGMLPRGADAVVMLEHTQVAPAVGSSEIEILKPVAVGENVIQVGEDVKSGQVVIPRGTILRPAEIGGLMALGLTSLEVAHKPAIGLISCGDELVSPNERPQVGQVRDINAYSLAAAVSKWGGTPTLYGIVPDEPELLEQASRRALAECDCVIITAGSSASVRDQTASVINSLGRPGVLVHGVNTRPGKPTILGVCQGKPVLGLPGNPVSALVNSFLFLLPLMERLLGIPAGRTRPMITARLAVNLASEAGREDWWPVKLLNDQAASETPQASSNAGDWVAEPVFGRSNLIFSLAAADGLLRIPSDVNGLAAGAEVDVYLL